MLKLSDFGLQHSCRRRKLPGWCLLASTDAGAPRGAIAAICTRTKLEWQMGTCLLILDSQIQTTFSIAPQEEPLWPSAHPSVVRSHAWFAFRKLNAPVLPSYQPISSNEMFFSQNVNPTVRVQTKKTYKLIRYAAFWHEGQSTQGNSQKITSLEHSSSQFLQNDLHVQSCQSALYAWTAFMKALSGEATLICFLSPKLRSFCSFLFSAHWTHRFQQAPKALSQSA